MRQSAAERREDTTATQETGRVVATSPGSVVVRTGAGEVRARRAVSCLVEPELGDDVLLAIHGAGCHVLAVLERPAGSPTRIVAPGDLEIAAPAGRLTLESAEAIDVATGGDVSFASRHLRAVASSATLAIESLNYAGAHVAAHVESVKAVAKSIESVADRWIQRLERSYRFIAESEHVRSRYLGYEASSCIQMRGKAAIVSSAELTKVDGSQIHVG
jgi:hypothetical protein